MIQYVDEGRAAGKPFFATIAFQAVHSPLPGAQGRHREVHGALRRRLGRIRDERYRRQVAMGLVPDGLEMPWSRWRQGVERIERRPATRYAKKMAVYAAMVDNADQQIGRFREHLKSIGQLDNTVFIVMSDNGADAYDLSQLNLPFRLWYGVDYSLGYETLGERGSYVHYGQDWAAVSNTPFSLFKGTSAEGGMRVPFIVRYPGKVPGGRVTDQFAYVTDFLPTVLDIAGIALPGDEYRGRKLHRPTGTSLLPSLEGKTPAAHGPSEVIGMESTGGQALFVGDYKWMRNGAPWATTSGASTTCASIRSRRRTCRPACPTWPRRGGRGGAIQPEQRRRPARGRLRRAAPGAEEQLARAAAANGPVPRGRARRSRRRALWAAALAARRAAGRPTIILRPPGILFPAQTRRQPWKRNSRRRSTRSSAC